MTTTLQINNGTITLPSRLSTKLNNRKIILKDNGDVINIYIIPIDKNSLTDRQKIWESVRGTWKNRKVDPFKELQKIRKEWDRKF